MDPQSQTDLVALLRAAFPTWSEFRSKDSSDADLRNLRKGRRVRVPLSVDPPGVFTGRLFTDPSIQPAPTTVVRVDGLDDDRTTTVYLAWDFSPNLVPAIPVVMMLVRWGVGGNVYTRMLDVHRVERRISLNANFVEVLAVYLDLGAGVASVDAVVGIATSSAHENHWTGTWLDTAPVSAAVLATQPAAILAAAGTVLNIGTAAGVYFMLVDTAVLPVSGTSAPIPGSVSPLLTAGQSFAFDEDEMPGVFADFGVAFAISTTPNLFVAPGGGTASVWAQLKCAF